MLACQMSDLVRAVSIFKDSEFAGASHANQKELLNDESKAIVRQALELAKTESNKIGLVASLDKIALFENALNYNFDFEDFKHQSKSMVDTIMMELRHHWFSYVPPYKANVLQNYDNTWKVILQKFPSAQEDCQEANFCYALGRNTACVFHTCRIAEIGLRAIARERKVKLRKDRPLEWAQWQEIIQAIEKEADRIALRKPSKAKDLALEFYRGAIYETEGFKDAYRNNVTHGRRKTFSEPEAGSVLHHVWDFMNRLSVRLDENSTKKIDWRKVSEEKA